MARATGTVKIHDRNGILLSGIAGRRCRLQGLNDAQLYTGWVTRHENGVITILSSCTKNPNPGDFLYIEVDAPTCIVTFVAYVTVFHKGGFEVKVSSEVDERPLKNESRLLVAGLRGKITAEGYTFPIEVQDVSENGVGFTSEEPFTSGSCTLVISSAFGAVAIGGDVRYCRKEPTPNLYRGGVQILKMDRVGRARWARVMGGS